MKCILSAQDLREALAVVNTVVSRAPQDRRLVRLSVTGQSVQLQARASSGSARADLAPQGATQDGWLVVSWKTLTDAAKAFTGDTVEIDAKDHRAKVTDGRTAYILLGDDDWPDDETQETFWTIGTFAPDALRSAVERAASAAARDQTRYAIDGVLLETEGTEARFVGTDGRRLHLTRLLGAEEGNEPGRRVIPADLFRAAVRAMGSESEVSITSQGSWVFVGNGTAEIGIPLTQRDFPDYQAVIPQGGEMQVDLDTEELAGLVHRVGIMSPRDMRVVRLEWREGKVFASAESSDQGRADDSVVCAVDGEHKLCANADYFADALKAMESEECRFQMSGEDAPMRFDAEGVTAVLMPVSGA